MKTSVLLFAAAAALVCSSCTSRPAPQAAYDYAAMTAAPDTANVVIETIMARRSVRQYKDTPVPRDLMQVILQCGINAPNGMNAQPWEVRVVDSPDFLSGITALQMGSMGERGEEMKSQPGFRNMFRNAPTVVFIAARDGSGQIDCGLMGENMILAAQSLGLGSCCLGGPVAFLNSGAADEYVARLQLPEGYKVLYAIGMGYPDETPDAKPRDAAKVRFVE